MKHLKQVILSCLIIGLILLTGCAKTEYYTLVFNTDCDIEIDNAVIETKKTYELPVIEREDYVFDGWYLDIDCIDGPYSIIKFDEEKEIELFAKWSDVDYSNAINLNNKIGKLKNSVTLEKEQLITDLQYKYDSLSEKEKTYITNYNVLVQAWKDLNVLKQTDSITNFITELKAEYTLEDLESLKVIYEQYEGLDQDSLAYLKDYYLEELNTYLDIYDGLLQQIQGYQSVIDLIDAFTGNKNITDLYNVAKEYYQLNKYQQAIVNTKYTNLLNNNTIANQVTSSVVDYIANLNLNIGLETSEELEYLSTTYTNLTPADAVQLTQINALEMINDIKYRYQAYVIQDDICQTKYIIDEITKQEIIDVYNRYNNLPESYKSYINNYELLTEAYNRVTTYNNLQKNYQVTYVLGKDLQNTKEELAKNFWNSFYNFIYTYGVKGKETLLANNINNPEDFYNMSIDYDGGRNHLYNLGDNFGSYLLQKDLNGIIENQPKTKFYGYAYQNGMYLNDWDFFIVFFGDWRIDEGYAEESNYGADTFAESWAPTVDLCKFFYYDENTSYVKTNRMKDLLNRVTSVCYGDLNNNLNPGDELPTLTLRNYTFAGWYDNPEFTGDAYTTVPNDKITLYAKFEEDHSGKMADQAALVSLYYNNLQTSVCDENATTVGYLASMYQELDNEGLMDLGRDQWRIMRYLGEWGYQF